ncbi:DNA polymerase III subunit alpha [Geminicoccus harenae]|uniref:DNA polymerase III subunit alpha n=1 Tax=Geminicoccus harenae TaxID=2498453 RepID=UPI00168BAFB3|nr:DNA polymerase III subunit alpha [Geminicoccus harenae]
MAIASFVHLRVHSCFSLLEASIKAGELAKKAKALGMPAVAITDSCNLFGVMEFCKEATKAGIQPVVGALLALVPEGGPEPRRPQTGAPPLQETEQLVFLVQNEAGYLSLSRLMTCAYLSGKDQVAVTMDELAEHSEGLIVFTGGAFGPIGQRLLRGDAKGARAMLERMKAVWPNRLYVEIQRHGLPEENATEGAMIDLAYALDLPLVATNDCHFLEEDHYEAHDALICIADGRLLIEDERRRFTKDHRFKSAEEMAELFADLPEAIQNTLVIAKRCAYEAPKRKPILPTFAADEEAEMRKQAAEGLEARLRQSVWTEGMDDAAREAAARPYRERLQFECDVIAQMKFPGYFLIVSDFIKWAKASGIPVGPGRGSGAGSVVAWSLSITDLDPLRFGLLFERFLNPERVSMPDFDIDFCQDRRDEVIRYVRDRYGHDRVASIITFGKLQAKAVIRDVGRVLGLPYGLVDKISKLIPHNPANPPTLEQAMAMEPRLIEARDSDPQVERMIEIARKLEGLPRHASTHAAGVVIGDRPLEELVPLYRDPRSDMPVTQFNMKDVETAGLVKFDFLGLTTLTMLTMGEKLVRERGTPLDLAKLALEDRRSYELLARAETAGVFQLESAGMRDALRKLKPDVFEDIIAMVSLYRPGPMDNIPRYIAVKHRTEEPGYLHPMLEPILGETNGVIIYQEQVMQIARELAGYSLGGADLLRRAMGKKIKEEMDAQGAIFVKGAAERGIDQDLAQVIFDQVAKFASYGFNKSHAAAYALLAYHTAYLKANHPHEFFASCMTMDMANQDKLLMFQQELRTSGITLLPPDVNASQVRFSVEETADGPAVRYALAAIKGVGSAAMEALVEERERGGIYTSPFDLVHRLGTRVINRRLLEALAKAGAFDQLLPNRRRICEGAEFLLRAAQAAQAEAESGQDSLFGGTTAAPSAPSLPEAEDWPALERLQAEMEAIGFYLSAHPLDGYATAMAQYGITPSDKIVERLTSGQPGRLKLAGVVLGKQERVTERSRFAHVAMSDPSGQFEVTLFSEILARTRELLESKVPLVIEADGRVDGDMVRLTAHKVEALEELLVPHVPDLTIRLSSVDAALAMRPLLTPRTGRQGRLRLVLAHAAGEVVLALPDGLGLPPGRRPDLERMAGVIEVREVATLH